MRLVQTTEELEEICARFMKAPYVCVDTEFVRQRTYYAQLSLIQLAIPEEVHLIDPLAEGLSLAPFFLLMSNPRIIKVFHAARQDVEILYDWSGFIPSPICDTQIAAAICGLGEQISYSALVFALTERQLDKTSRFTDWRVRPLTEKQLAYAAGDVTHLCDVYEILAERLEKNGRAAWLLEETALLSRIENYRNAPEDAWKRIKFHPRSLEQMSLLVELSAWREKEAQRRDVPRQRVLTDETIHEIAVSPPKKMDDFSQFRSFFGRSVSTTTFESIMAVIQIAEERDKETLPPLSKKKAKKVNESLSMLLRIALNQVAEENNISPRLIATSDELNKMACDDPDHVLLGWKSELFGKVAADVKSGKIVVGFDGRNVMLLRPPFDAESEPVTPS